MADRQAETCPFQLRMPILTANQRLFVICLHRCRRVVKVAQAMKSVDSFENVAPLRSVPGLVERLEIDVATGDGCCIEEGSAGRPQAPAGVSLHWDGPDSLRHGHPQRGLEGCSRSFFSIDLK